MTLHEAIEKVLKDAGKPLKASEIAGLINKYQLYSRGDNLPVPSSQIHARVKNYPEWFVKNPDGTIFLPQEKLDIFKDAVNLIFNRIRNNFLTDNGYVIALIIFYKRWTDHPGMLDRYSLKVRVNQTVINKADGFKSFYDSLGEQLTKQGKQFDKKLTESLFNGNGILFRDSIKFFESALSDLSVFNFSNSFITESDFGYKFTRLFTSDYINLTKSGQFSTPESLSSLMVSIASTYKIKSLYNPAGGYFTFPSMLFPNTDKDSICYCEEINITTYSLGLLNLISNGIPIDNASPVDSLLNSTVMDDSADLVICNPPYDRTSQNIEGQFPVRTSDSVTNFLQLAIQKVKSNGIIIFVVPERFLFSESKSMLSFRKYLVTENLIDTVISLPPGVFHPYSVLKTSIIIIKKDRSENGVIFLDAEKFCITGSKGLMTIETDLLTDQLKKSRIELNKGICPEGTPVLNEQQLNYGSYVWTLSDYAEINNNNFDFQVKRYLHKPIITEVREGKSTQVVKLKTILSPFKGQSVSSGSTLPFLRITELNKDFTKIYLQDSENIAANQKAGGHIIDRDLLLVGAIEGSLKPTFFKYNGRNILLSNDVYAFIPDTLKVDPEYLIYELASNHIADQIKAMTKGETIKRISLNDLIKIEIKLPPFEDQKKIAAAKREALAVRPVSEEFEEKIRKTAEKEKKILGALKHEISPVASNIEKGLKKLDEYLEESAENKKPVQWSDKVSRAVSSRSLRELMTDLRNEASKLSVLDDNIRQIIEISNDKNNLEETEIKRFLKEQVDHWEYKKYYNIVFSGEKKSSPDITIKINRKHFAMLIRNFLENTHKHGYPERNPFEDAIEHFGPYRNIVFDAIRLEDSVIVEMINDGQPFAKDFTFEQFISFGGHGGSSKGSGIGGFLMNQVVLNHGGVLKLLEPGRSLIIHPNYKTPPERILPMRQITAGIYFRIELPLTN